MKYLVTTEEVKSPFLTDWFDVENNFNKDIGMIVYDLETNHYTTNGKNWHEIEIDHL